MEFMSFALIALPCEAMGRIHVTCMIFYLIIIFHFTHPLNFAKV